MSLLESLGQIEIYRKWLEQLSLPKHQRYIVLSKSRDESDYQVDSTPEWNFNKKLYKLVVPAPSQTIYVYQEKQTLEYLKILKYYDYKDKEFYNKYNYIGTYQEML